MIKFTDIRPEFVGSSSFACPNECLVELRKLASTIDFTPAKAGSIASGGEVPLLVMLPAVDGPLKVVDHNYGSLWWTATKILMLQYCTTKEIRAIFAGAPLDCQKFFTYLAVENPIPVAKSSFKSVDERSSTNMYGYAFSYDFQALQKYWKDDEAPDYAIDAARERLANIELIHGDLRDIGTDNELLYISNALEHTPFDSGSYIEGTDGISMNALQRGIKSVMKPSGVILSSSHMPIDECVEAVKTDGKLHCCSWRYTAYRRVLKPTTKRFQYIAKEHNIKQMRIDPYYSHKPYALQWKFVPPVGKKVREYAAI